MPTHCHDQPNIIILLSVSLSDYQVRDLNDEINKLMGQKYHWEKRIVELGGPDYTVNMTRICD